MKIQNVIRTIGSLTLLLSASGILFLSLTSAQVQAKELTTNGYQQEKSMMNVNEPYGSYNSLTPEQKEKMISMMKKHHGNNWQSHHQQMHSFNKSL